MSLKLPSVLFAGDKLEFTESESDYKASDGWTMKYKLINSSTSITDLVSTADGDDHKFSITSAVSADWETGFYRFLRYAQKDSTYEHLDRGVVEVKPDIIALSTWDFRTHARKTLEAIEAAIERRATKEQMSIAIGVRGSSRQLQYLTMDELIKARNYYQNLVNREDQKELIAQGKSPGNKVLIQFNSST